MTHTCFTCGRHLPMHRKPKAHACSRSCQRAYEDQLRRLERASRIGKIQSRRRPRG
jgi:hypothetical protein